MAGWLHAQRQRRLIDAVIAERSLHMVYQPIVDAVTMQPVGVEALARFERPNFAGPEQWFAAARAVHRAFPLEIVAASLAVADAQRLPQEYYLAINIGPETMQSSELIPLLTSSGIAPERLVIELTEHTKVNDYKPLLRARHALGEQGIRVSVDDVGAGYASLRHVLALKPEFAKLDRDLIVGFERDRARQSLVTAALTFAHSEDMTLVAEGVETDGEARKLAELGMDQLQGNAIGLPGPLDEVPAH